jgi:hypothetical protein
MLLPRLRHLAFGLDHTVSDLCMPLLAVGQLHVQCLEALFGRGTAFLQLRDQGLDFGQFGADLLAAGAGLFRQLREAHRLYLELVRTSLRLGSLSPRVDELLRSVGERRFGAHQRRSGLLGNQRLSSQLFFQVLDFLLAREQARLLRILRVEAHTVRADGMAALDIDDFARAQLVAAGQRVFETGRRITAMQPIGEQGLLPGVAEAQQIGEARQGTRPFGRRRLRQAVESPLRRRRSGAEGSHGIESRHFQRIHALAQRCFQSVLPPGLHVDAAP